MDVNQSLSGSCKGFTKFTLLKEKPPKGQRWSREGLTKIQATTKKKPSETQGESWKFQWRRQCLAKKGTKKHSQLHQTEAKSGESHKIPKTKHACIVEAHESTRHSLESSLPKDHEDHIAGKGHN